jgi:hypothetical protein
VYARLREAGPVLLAAAVGVWLMTFLGLYGFGWNDYSTEAAPAYSALVGGHLWRFLELAPGYGGSLELRAPFALLGALGGGREVSVYRAVSIPCLVAAALLGVWLVGELRARRHSLLARATALGLCVANPVTLYALQDGHVEELLGAVLCVAAVLVAERGRFGWAGLALGLAVVNKQWALVAVGPVLLALPAGRLRSLAIAAGVAVCFYAPLVASGLLGGGGSGGGGAVTTTGGGAIFQPWQLWWFLGSHSHGVRDAVGVLKVGYRTPPGWVESIAHPLIVVLALPATLLAARLRRRDPLLLLAFVLALRFALDPWDTVYYPLPFLFALLAWEALRFERPPLLTLSASVAVWLVFVVAPEHVSADAQAALFALFAVPALVALAFALYASPGRSQELPERHHRHSSAASATPISTV